MSHYVTLGRLCSKNQLLVKSQFSRYPATLRSSTGERCNGAPVRATNIPNYPVRNYCQAQQVETKPYDINTNVIKDVVLFKYENPKFYKFLNLFAISQLFFWTYMSHFAFTTLRDAPVDETKREELPWWRSINLGENKYRNTLAICSFLIGYGILASAWMFTLKSVRFLVLRKGGDRLTFVTYGPFGKNRMMTVPIDKVSCKQNREAARVQLPIKVQNVYLHYMLDMRGQFTNTRLFDYTAGLKRQI